MDTTKIPVSKISTEIDWDRIILFRRRFNILWGNFKDLNIGTLSGGFSKTDKGGYKGGFDLPNEYRLKSLYVDFRHFYLNDEPTNINSFANYLATLTNSDEFRTFIKNEKKKLKSEFIENGWFQYNEENLSTKKLLDIWFNAEIFHNNPIKVSILLEWQNIFEDQTAKSMLFMAVYDYILIIRNINWSCMLLDENSLYLRMPNNAL